MWPELKYYHKHAWICWLLGVSSHQAVIITLYVGAGLGLEPPTVLTSWLQLRPVPDISLGEVAHRPAPWASHSLPPRVLDGACSSQLAALSCSVCNHVISCQKHYKLFFSFLFLSVSPSSSPFFFSFYFCSYFSP